MPKNLKNLFRTELINQRKKGAQASSRHEIKQQKGGKIADYRRIYSDNSYKSHLARARQFADYLRNETKIRKMSEITPQVAKEYLIHQRDSGASSATIGSDALAINHLMIGSGNWEENQRVVKSNISNMPKRSVVYQRYKPLTSEEWRAQNKDLYEKYQNQIDTIRAFGLRRSELTSGTSLHSKDGLGPKTIFRSSQGKLEALVQGKGGKVRFAEVREDLSSQMERLYGSYAQPKPNNPVSSQQYKALIRNNKPFYRPFSHNIPTHIFRADYAQNKLIELDRREYKWFVRVPVKQRVKKLAPGKYKWRTSRKLVPANKQYQIGEYRAQYGAFQKLSQLMGHNRLDVLNHYLGIGR